MYYVISLGTGYDISLIDTGYFTQANQRREDVEGNDV